MKALVFGGPRHPASWLHPLYNTSIRAPELNWWHASITKDDRKHAYLNYCRV